MATVTEKCTLTAEQLKALPLCFSNQAMWLHAQGARVACDLFDAFGWREGWVPIAEIASALFPDFWRSTRLNYTRAVVLMLVAEGKVTGDPQLKYRRGFVSFEVQS